MIHTIETVSGMLVDPTNPDKDTLLIKDAAWAISRINRYAGHTITKIPYNVAQHCCFVADMIYEETQSPIISLFGLLHDIGESFTGDIPSPIKKIPELRAVIVPIEDRLLNMMYEKYIGRIPIKEENDIVKKFDYRALLIEAHNFMNSRGKNWIDRDKHDIGFVELQNFPEPVESVVAFQLFMKQYDYYHNLMKKQKVYIDY